MDLRELRVVVERSTSPTDVLRRLGYKTLNGIQLQAVRNSCEQRGISTSHFISASEAKRRHHSAVRAQVIDSWLAGNDRGYTQGWQMDPRRAIKSWLLGRAHHQCELCGWKQINPFSEKSPLQIHHIDGDASNCKPQNLQVLCPNCHSLTDTFGRRNRKSARTYRRAAEVHMGELVLGKDRVVGSIPTGSSTS